MTPPPTVRFVSALSALAAALVLGSLTAPAADVKQPPTVAAAAESLDDQIPNESLKLPFAEERPLSFLAQNQDPAKWAKLPAFWNPTTEKARDPRTGQEVERKAVVIKVPLGLTQAPPIPPENPPTVPRWLLGKRLFFDTVLSSDNSVSCASCHSPNTGYTTHTRVSTGIRGLKGGMNGPTVLNAAYNLLQFWDGRAASLEDQAQGPPQNPVEMFDGQGDAWHRLVERVRQKGDYRQRFREVFGTEPTRDAIAKAIATYERTVLVGNSIHDRADWAMKLRVADGDGTTLVVEPRDYQAVLKEAVARKDLEAMEPLGIDPARDQARLGELAKRLNNGRALFFGKANCSLCHAGDNFTDHQFHNLGVGANDGQLPPDQQGRYARLMTGHKNPEQMGAFKTPGLRGLVRSEPYMHDGGEATLEKVVEFYDRGGNANEFLDSKMRDADAERAYAAAREQKKPYAGPPVTLCGKDRKPVVPRKLNLTDQEKNDLVLFLRALTSDPVDPLVADRDRVPPGLLAADKR